MTELKPESWPRAQALFKAVLQRDAAQRPAFLAEACDGDAELKAQIEQLLVAHERAKDAMKTPVFGGRAALDQPVVAPATVGDQIGRYHIRDVLGEGGFAVVYLAEQNEPIRRQVALKIIKLGLDTKQVMTRFQAEQQALALMNHPGIARVLESGATETGRPYFAMELVNGRPITEYCDSNNLDLADRLELFVTVCRAIQHAHHKGIIHRDLKPSNVLVADNGHAQVKVIDFGIAKAIDQQLTEKTIFTERGHLVGTPEYMSPEQAETSGHDVDTRTDIYSLGVLLYELLTGTTPFDPTTLRAAGYAGIQRIIGEEEPPRPSTRLSTLGDALIGVARRRRAEPQALSRFVRGDLDWIVMKAIEKDRARRYETADSLATDIERYLSHQPVLASPPSPAYKLRKFIRRHRLGVTAGALVTAALLTGLTLAMIGLLQARRDRDRLQEALAMAQAAEDDANRQARIAQAVNVFLNDDLLAAVDPRITPDREITMREVLDAAAEKIEGQFNDEPLVEASIRATLGKTYLSLGQYDAAEQHLVEALRLRQGELGAEHAQSLTTMSELGALYWSQSRYDEAEALQTEALELHRRVLGPEDPETLTAMNNLANLYEELGRYDEAEPLHLEALETRRRVLGPEHRKTLISMINLAALYEVQDRYDEAEPLYVDALEIQRRVLGEEHPDTLSCMNNLALLYNRQRRTDEAEPLYLESLEIKKRVLGEEHPSVLVSMHNLAAMYKRLARFEEAVPLFERTLDIARRTLGPEHAHTLFFMNSLAVTYEEQGRAEEAVRIFAAVASLARRSLPEGHWYRGMFLCGHGRTLSTLGRYDEAESALREGYEI
ncbi:MAG: serine/threonine protein kinase, partial [Planctomycetota bacterium]